MPHALGRSSLGDESVGSEDNDYVRTAFYWLVVDLGAPASPWASVSSSAKMSTLTMPDVRGCLGSKSHKVPVSCYFINATYYYHYDIYNFCWYNFLYFLFGNNFKLTSTKNTCLLSSCTCCISISSHLICQFLSLTSAQIQHPWVIPDGILPMVVATCRVSNPALLPRFQLVLVILL